jgi:RND family efflux transporter MFP subunit
MATVLTLGLFGAAGCGGTPAPPKEAPAKVTGAVPEGELNHVQLSDSALIRLGIETAVVDTASLVATVPATGEVIVPPGRLAVLTAPVAGTVLPPASGSVAAVGSRVMAGQELFRLAALPSQGEMVHSTEAVAVAEARWRTAQAEADRVERLWADRLVAARERERVQGELSAARAARDAARSQQALLRGAPDSGSAGAALRVVAPESGVLQQLHVAPGQAVSAGTPIAEVARLDLLWVRVPLFGGDAAVVDRQRSATVLTAAGRALPAPPVVGPRAADPATGAVELHYAVRGELRPGERVRIAVPREGSLVRELVVPHAAILYDIHGNAWVYEQLDAHSFARRRVEIDRVADGRAVLRRGPPVGTRIVVAGAAEVFGTEFGGGK